jgi:hypothetical protein
MGGLMGKNQTAPVSVRALVQRINRKLAARGEKLMATRSDRWRGELGDYYAVKVNGNSVVVKHVDLATLGRELGALQPWESVAE